MAPVAHWKMVLEYDGAAFSGWQRQARGERTVQGSLEDAIQLLTGQDVDVVGAGRTDAGVHAEAQVASTSFDTTLSPAALARALNSALPSEMVVREIEAAEPEFDARYGARSKLYRYSIWNGALRSPLRQKRCYAVRQPLELAAMEQAARALVGEHDFASFQAAGSSVRSSVRRILRLDVLGAAGGEVLLEVEGTGFLRHMVRNLAGTLIEVGLGRREAGSMAALLAAGDRSQAGPTAPARGLTLVWVRYQDQEPGSG